MKCGLNFGNIKEYVIPEKCHCRKRCNQINYRFESITQSLKNNIFSIFLPPWSAEKNLHVKAKRIQQGSLIQLWAFLREANMTAFDDLRQLSIYLEKLIYFVNYLEKNINIFQDKLLNDDKNYCGHTTKSPKKSNKIFVTGMEFVKFMKSSPLMKDLEESPLELIHIHLVHLFFKGIDSHLHEIEKFIQHSDFITALSMFHYPTRDNNCGQQMDQSSKNVGFREPSEENMKSKDQTNYLQKLFLLFTWNFKKFKVKCEENVKYNLNIIQSLSNFSYKKPNKNGYDETIVTLTVQMLNESMAFKMESVQNLYDPQIAIIDIIMSGLVIAFVFITLLNKCLSINYENCKTGTTFNNQRETTIQNNLSQKFNQYRENSIHSRDMESPITTFHLI